MLTGARCCWVGFAGEPPHYKNLTLSSNKGQKLAACSSDKAGEGVRAASGGGISYTLRVWADGGR